MALTAAVREASAAALEEHARRRLLVVIPLSGFAVVGVLLYLKLREIERGGGPDGGTTDA
jgi:hypothetical protein